MVTSLAQWVKDPAMAQLWRRSQLQLRFNSWARNFHGWGLSQKKKKKYKDKLCYMLTIEQCLLKTEQKEFFFKGDFLIFLFGFDPAVSNFASYLPLLVNILTYFDFITFPPFIKPISSSSSLAFLLYQLSMFGYFSGPWAIVIIFLRLPLNHFG